MYRKKLVLSRMFLSAFMILLLLTFVGCGNKQNNAENSSLSTLPTTNNSPVGAVSYENYLKIKLDSTYDDVKKILGEGSKKVISPDVVSYSWGESGKTINIQIKKDKVDSKTQTMLGESSSTVTLDQFNKVTNGMTFDQVVSILGPDYQESSYKKSANGFRRVVIWMRPDNTNVTVVLEDNKVFNKYNFLK